MSDRRREIMIVVPDPQWVALFRDEARALRRLFGERALAVHHIGSTSVPGLAAKPTIDILLEVRDIEKVDQFDQAMRHLGYTPRGSYGLPRRRYFPRIEESRHLSHVHAWQTGDPEIERHLAFRDYLIAYPETRDAYGRLKQELAARFTFDKESYMDGKDAFCQETERRAVAWQRAISAYTIETPRLTLTPLNPAQLLQRLSRPRQLAGALHIQYARVALKERVRRAIRHKARQLEEALVEAIPWHSYWLVIVRDTSLAAGLIGFKGAPNVDGAAEIGYGIDPPVRGQGYATEAVGALRDWALSQPACRAVTARTDKENLASIRVLQKAGFALTGQSEDEYCWITSEGTV